MKKIKRFFASVIVMLVLVPLTGCDKNYATPDLGANANVMIPLGPGEVFLSFGFSIHGTLGAHGRYYPYNQIPRGIMMSVAYITSRPINQTTIAVVDQNNNPMGIVDCVTGDWRLYNNMYEYILAWNYKQKYAVWIHWDPGYQTGHIIG